MLLNSSMRVLVVAAHPDDEVLGCGATLAKWASLGAQIQVAFVADGVGARAQTAYSDLLADRRIAAIKASKILNTAKPIFGDVPDNQADSIPLLQIVKTVEALIDQHQPDIVLTHHGGDLNIDHRRVQQAVMTACRPQQGLSVRTVLFFEVPSSTEWQSPQTSLAFLPTWFEDVTDTFAIKLEALEAYSAELRKTPHPRSIEGVTALANWRGATIGTAAAEAFVLGRHIQ